MNYEEAIKYLDSFINYEFKNSYSYKDSFKLTRMERLADILGNPQDGIRSIHIAGSKGKGSTSAITQSILRSAGFNAGLYTSPHLQSFRERIRINDSLISEDDIARFTDKVKMAVCKMGHDKPTFFEAYTALAYLYFKEKGVDFAVYETGLGGRLDATNIVKPLVCAITPISYEHTDKLGSTLSEIAFEKAGIIKEGSICVSAPQEKEALDTIARVSKERKAKLVLVGTDISFKEISGDDTGEIFSVSGAVGKYERLKMKLLGSHQVVNAASAIAIIESLRFSGTIIPEDAIVKGVEEARWPGRLEVVSRDPLVVLDGAQNKASALALASSIRRFKYKRLILVLGVSGDKDIKGILEALMPVSDSVVLTRAKITARAADPEGIRKLMDPSKKTTVTYGVDDAMNAALLQSNSGDLVLVTGSLFVVGEARSRYA